MSETPALSGPPQQMNIQAGPQPTDSQQANRRFLTSIFSSIRSKIIFPYLILTFLVAGLGTFIVTRLIAGTLEERFANQLLEASRVAGDGIVRREEANLEVLRLMVFTIGVDDAVADGDALRLRELVEPLAANADLDGVLVVDNRGQEILGLHALRTVEGTQEYQVTQGQDLLEWPLVTPVLAGEVDVYGDKYAGLVNTPGGMFLYTSGPVKNEDNEIVGAVLVGESLDRVLRLLKAEALADVTFYGVDGLPVASTFPNWQAGQEQTALQIAPTFYEMVLDSPEEQTLFSEVQLYERDFRAAFVPLRIRRDTLGVLGVVLPSNFIVQAASTSRTLFSLLFSVAAGLAVLLGLLVAQRIVRPVMRLLQVSRAITEGDLSQRVGIAPNDELGVLAQSFDSMTDHLQESTVKLQQEIARVKAILRSIADGVIVRDIDGGIIMMNTAAQAMLARTPDFESSDLARIGTASEEINSLRANSFQPHRLEIGDRVVSTRIAPVLTERGEAIGNVLVMRDVTREAAAERLKDDFINSISHELRTPLTVIKGYSDLMRTDLERVRADTHDRAMGAIFTNAEALERMIAKLIDLSEMAAGTLQLDTVRLDFRQFVVETVNAWDERLQEARLTPKVRTGTGSLTVVGDTRRLQWALDALLENACQYSPKGGKLVVSLSRVGSAAVLQMKDPGVGIAREDLPHVFQRFYRGRALDVRGGLIDPRGMGQGLYVVKSVVEAHGGRVWVESESGKGSEFSILLPLSEEAE